jgi:adenylosuccinate lyase
LTANHYENPLATRYASREMSQLWSPLRKFSTWRRLWVALAEAQRELGLAISQEQISQMRAKVDDVDLDAAARYERQLRHDVMAHVHAYGDQCPAARPIIHLGATSCYVTDNTDLLLLRDALELVRRKLVRVIDRLATFAQRHADLPCLAYTHFQPAQPTTLGKRASLWAYDLVLDLADLEHRLASFKALGAKGTTGTQASFLALFGGDEQKVKALDALICQKLGIPDSYAVTGQTYPRKLDFQVLALVSGIAQSCHKAATDLRLLQHEHEIEEPFEEKQIGSSAMAYKRNPMRAERICGLARFVMSLLDSAAQTASNQWLERTLDDSANRRLVLPQAFLAVDAVLILYQNVVEGLVVYPNVIARHLAEELPFMATENLLMAAVARGGDRQELHERIRQHSLAAAQRLKQGESNDLLERLANDPHFAGLDFNFLQSAEHCTGRAGQQVREFLAQVIDPIRARHREYLAGSAHVSV